MKIVYSTKIDEKNFANKFFSLQTTEKFTSFLVREIVPHSSDEDDDEKYMGDINCIHLYYWRFEE